jgi:hypothetical protein
MVAFEKALTESGAVSPEQLRLARERVKAEAMAALGSPAEPTLEQLLAMLREFEGPVQ